MISDQCIPAEGVDKRSVLRTGLLAAGLLVLLVLLYLPTLGYEFTPLDDMTYVGDNAHVQQGINSQTAWWALTSVDHNYWIPVTRLSFLLDGSLCGTEPASYRFTNILFHAANGVLVFLLLYSMTGCLWRSLFVALLFGSHPLRVESVVWVSERKDVLSTFFGLLTLLAYQRFVNRKRDMWYVLALVFFLLSLASKPMLVVLPAVLLLLDVWPLQQVRFDIRFELKTVVRLIVEKVPFLLVSIVFALLTLVSQSESVHSVGEGSVLLDRLSLMTHNYLFYLKNLFVPAGLSVEYPAVTDVSMTYWVVGTVLLVALSVGALASVQRRGWFFAGWFWFVGVMLPVSGIVRVGSVTMADRFSYVPSIGIFIIAVWWCAECLKRYAPAVRRWFAGSLMVVVAVVLIALTLSQQRHWRTARSLLSRSYDLYGGTMIVRNNLGIIHFVEGDEENAFRLFCLADGEAGASNQMGLLLMRFGRVDEAILYFQRAVGIEPDEQDYQENLATARAYAGRGE